MSALVGKKLKDYFVLRRLGHGAMAEVYLAQQLSLGRQVALKVLNAELARDPTYVRRFHHEARAAAALVHAGIVQIYEVGQDDGVHFIAQEYVAGRNLGELIRSQGRLDPGLSLDVLRQVAAALVKAASEGIVHRDIKPENIMVAAATGEVKVADFGLARVQGDGGMNLTQIGVTMGTPLYMSPEQVEGQPLDSRSDIYSLGVTAYHMLSGMPPFNGDTPLAVAVQHLNQPPEPLQTRRPELPAGLAELVHRMLAKKPADRYADPGSLLRELRALVRQAGDEGWAASSENGALGEMIAAADGRAAATSRLDAVTKTAALASLPRASNKVRRRWIVAAAASLLLGASLAGLARPRPLLADARNGPPSLANVWAQLYHAKTVDTEAAWRAVEEHFPDEGAYYKQLAKQGLVQFYFRIQDYERALEPLRQLADDSRQMFRAFGVAGLVVAYAKLGRTAEAHQENERLTGDMQAVLRERSPQLDRLLDQVRQELNQPP